MKRNATSIVTSLPSVTPLGLSILKSCSGEADESDCGFVPDKTNGPVRDPCTDVAPSTWRRAEAPAQRVALAPASTVKSPSAVRGLLLALGLKSSVPAATSTL